LLVAVCFTLSGAAGLIYEVLWMRMLGLVFGATTIAVSVVLAAFMGGLALGSAWAARSRVRNPETDTRVCVDRNRDRFVRAAVPTAFRAIDYLDAIVWQRIHPARLALPSHDFFWRRSCC
jgi:predicted membrane-bound spermidine synthase